MSEQYRLIKHNKNLAEIRNNKSVGLLFLVDEDCERKLRIIVDWLNEQQSIIRELRNENIISKNKIEDLRVSLFMLNKELERQMQKSGLDDK